MKVSPELFTVLEESLKLHRKSRGAFDVTVGRLVMQWRRARFQQKLPTEENIQKALKLTGSHLIKLNRKQQAVELLKEKMRLDLGGIAKGYIADETLKVLNRHSIRRAMIDAGGDLVLGEAPPNEPGWKIEIESLKGKGNNNDGKRNSPRWMLLKNCGIATSGDAYQYVEIDGVRYSHIVNPKTGVGLAFRSSVTVIAKNGMTADAFASAISVLGVKEGLKLIETENGTEALIQFLDEQGEAIIRTSVKFDRVSEESLPKLLIAPRP